MQGIRQRPLDAFRRVDGVAFGARLQVCQQVLGGFHADIAGEKQGFELFEQFVVDLATRKNGFELAAELRPRTGQTGFQPFAP